MTITGRVLASLQKLRHFAKASFIQQVANEDCPTLKPLDYSDVQVILDNLFEDGRVEHRMINTVSCWRPV